MEQLDRNPDERRKLIDDPGKIPLAIEEMLRWVTPIKNMARTATRDASCAARPSARAKGAAALPLGKPRRARLRRAAALHRRPAAEQPRRLRRLRRALLPRREPGAARAARHVRGAAARVARRRLESATTLALRPSNFIVGIEQMPIVFAPRALA